MNIIDKSVFLAYWKLYNIFAYRHKIIVFFWLLPIVTLIMWFAVNLDEDYEMRLSSFFGDYLISNIHVLITNFAIVFAAYYLIKLDLDGRERGALILSRVRPQEPIITLSLFITYIAIPQAIIFFGLFAIFNVITNGVVLSNNTNLLTFNVNLLLTSLIILFNALPNTLFIACGYYGRLELFTIIGLLSSFMLSLPPTFILDKWGFGRLTLYFAMQVVVSMLWLSLAYFLGLKYYRPQKLLPKNE